MTRTAIVTGGLRGFGVATAERPRADGIRVITLDLAEGDTRPDHHRVDISDDVAVQASAEAVGPVDILVNCAGIVGPNTPLVQTTPDEWRRTIDVNGMGTVATIRAFAPGMVERGSGRIVNVASMAGKDGDLINTGTPPGVGLGTTPRPTWQWAT